MRKRNILAVGKNSKLLRGILKTGILKSYNLEICSIRESAIVNPENEVDSIIYFVANAKTNISEQEVTNLIETNCLKLCEFLLYNEWIQDCRFIYISTIKTAVLTVDDGFITEIAQKIIDCVRNNNRNSTQLVDRILKQVNELTEIYALSKLIAEKIITLLVNHFYILRPDYVFGFEESENLIYKYIESVFNNDTLFLPEKTRGFITYNDISRVIVSVLEDTTLQSVVIDIYAENQITLERLIADLNLIKNVVNSKSEIEYISSSKEIIKGQNHKLSELYREIMDEEFVFDNFNDVFLQIFYRLYIERILGLCIVQEYIGGSYAKVYKACRNGKDYSVKISLGNGADNGCVKLCDEVRQLKAIDMFIGNKRQQFRMTPLKIIQMYNSDMFSYVVSEWENGHDIFHSLNNGDSGNNFVRNVVKEIADFYKMKRTPLSINSDIVKLNVDRLLYRMSAIVQLSVDMKKIIESESVVINNKSYLGIPVIIDTIRSKWGEFSETWGLCISGDAIFDNFIIKENGEICVLDSRGRDLLWAGDDLPYFYPAYDFAKMLFYFLGWKEIRMEWFKIVDDEKHIDFKFQIMHKRKIELMLDACKEAFEAIDNVTQNIECIAQKSYIKNVLLLVGVHFLCDAYPRICGKGCSKEQCKSELVIGIIILNIILKNSEETDEYIWKEIVNALWNLIEV